MPILTRQNSKTMTIRLPLSTVEQVEDFAAEHDLTISGALRVLLETGLHEGLVNAEDLRSVQYNANAAAFTKLEQLMEAMVEEMQRGI